jgi:DNA-binding MarR family transcriptional regulator
MTLADLDPVLTPPKRLGIMAMLDAAKSVEFSFLREHLDVSDSDLSKQMSLLCDAGYARVRKTGHGRGSSTWFAITTSGKRAFDGHVEALRRLIDDAPAAATHRT